ncbi:uncharacterized protein EI97DRAFT_87177 [Westerdykella ornata]|uniref:Uncharacterized protein n=1 Tax=Westerdykella ornata TaxID=318751 RepID=A0A6A6JJN3_WESOR|nr:uncharacterized protein EI97DRAFT_87177 [Westerdykella ornata]KAF2275079.1 hypothetical protein EI97DRAFT_87177 [Westerdykella ornata]
MRGGLLGLGLGSEAGETESPGLLLRQGPRRQSSQSLGAEAITIMSERAKRRTQWGRVISRGEHGVDGKLAQGKHFRRANQKSPRRAWHGAS